MAVVELVDKTTPTAKATEVRANESWPPYNLAPDLPLVSALSKSAAAHLGKPVPLKVVGPSNIGNYLAGFDIPTICGFGVNYKNIHAANECLEGDSQHRADLSHLCRSDRSFAFGAAAYLKDFCR